MPHLPGMGAARQCIFQYRSRIPLVEAFSPRPAEAWIQRAVSIARGAWASFRNTPLRSVLRNRPAGAGAVLHGLGPRCCPARLQVWVTRGIPAGSAIAVGAARRPASGSRTWQSSLEAEIRQEDRQGPPRAGRTPFPRRRRPLVEDRDGPAARTEPPPFQSRCRNRPAHVRVREGGRPTRSKTKIATERKPRDDHRRGGDDWKTPQGRYTAGGHLGPEMTPPGWRPASRNRSRPGAGSTQALAPAAAVPAAGADRSLGLCGKLSKSSGGDCHVARVRGRL